MASKNQNNAIVCWLDTSVQGRGHRVFVEDVELEPSGERLLNSLARWQGMTVWLAAYDHVSAEAAQRGEPSPFTAGLLKGLGTPERPNNVYGCLDAIQKNDEVTRQGFRSRGGVSPLLSLWPREMRRDIRPVRELVVQRSHADRIRGISLTADGHWMATASMDSTLRIWRLDEHDQVLFRVDADHHEGVESLAMSPDGRWIATGDGAGRVRVWDRIEQRAKGAGNGPPPHSGVVGFVGFLPDSRRFVSLDEKDGKLLLWDVAGAVLRSRPLIESGATLTACATLTAPDVTADLPAVAAVDNDGKIRLFKAYGLALKAQDDLGEFVTALELSADGRMLAVGGENGAVSVRDTATGRELDRLECGAKIAALRFSGSSLLAVGAGEDVRVIALREERREERYTVVGGVGTLVFSADGHYLAASGAKVGGGLSLWKHLDGPKFLPAKLEARGDSDATAIALALAPDGRALIAGDERGGLHAWSLPDGRSRFDLPANRRKIGRLDVASDREHLLLITADGTAQVWDLGKRSVVALDGNWSAGAFLPDGATLVMTTDADLGGDVKLVDATTGAIRQGNFKRPNAAEADAPVATTFDKLAVSPDGRSVAAGSSQDYKPLACVWDVRTGALIQVIRESDSEALASIDFSPDGQRLLTGLDRSAKLWDLAGGLGSPRPVGTIDAGSRITCARSGPDPSRWIALGTSSGQVLLWKDGQDRPAPLPQMPSGGPVHALAFTRDGQWLVAASEDRRLRAWSLGERPQPITLDPSPHHDEQINALVAWPDRPMVVSGSDDTTARFWSLAERKLLGTFSAIPPAPPAKAKPKARPVPRGASDWIVFTPDGVFDSSPDGEDRVRWSYDGDVRTLEQYERNQYYHFQLADELRQGRRPVPASPPLGPPPKLAVELSTSRPVPRAVPSRDVTLTISLGEPGLKDLRLYQNGVPIQSDTEFQATPGDPNRFVAHARLKAGRNWFHAMASRPGSIDGKSPDVVAFYDGPDDPPRLHVLALGVSTYERRALRYAHSDAEEMATFLHDRGIEAHGEPGLRLVLTNDQVTEHHVHQALLTLRDCVKGRPGDTVVIFLAGHTGIYDDRFSLLLPTFPFPKNEPAIVAARAAEVGPKAEESVVLPYATLYSNLARFDALQRLVIVDACQAEAIFRDPEVGRIRKFMAEHSRQARTAYILAARRGEPAKEVTELKRGLLTYILLRGMDARLSGPRLDMIPIFRRIPDADLDLDGMITTRELRRYAELTLPPLAKHYPDLVRRGEGDRDAPDGVKDDTLRQALDFESEDVSFPLVPAGSPSGDIR